jgi:predicted DNA-binding transcriptional regulator YafY
VEDKLFKYMKYKEFVDMMYISNDGRISQRRIKVLEVSNNSFRAYCFLQGSTRTFSINNVLALVPVVHKEREVL